MRITVLFILTISWHRSGIQTQKCGKPEVTRNNVYIYRRPEQLPVKVNRCLYNDTKHAYSDITENCMRAFKTGIFQDKFQRVNYLRERGSPVLLEEYYTFADLIKNEIRLRSGATCRYDRGFCYDPSETNNYAVVWDVFKKPLLACPTRLELVFVGLADIWDFHGGQLKYLVYLDEKGDRAFYLKIIRKAYCDNKNLLITEGNHFIISLIQLDSDFHSGMLPKTYYFSMDTKKEVSEAIMRNCDLQQYPLDFTNRIGDEYLKDSKNLKTILEYYQQLIIGVKLDSERSSTKGGVDSNARILNIFYRNLTTLEFLVSDIIKAVNTINDNLKKLQQARVGENNNADMNVTMRIIQELRSEDKRIMKRVDNEHDALNNLDKKISDLDRLIRNQNVKYPTRTEFNRELSNIQNEINNKLQVFITKLDSVLKENLTNLKNNDSKFQKDIADRYDKSLEKIESDFENLDELVEDIRNQLESEVSSTNKTIIENFTLVKNRLASIERELSEIQPFLAKWRETENKTENVRKDLENHRKNLLGTILLTEGHIKAIQSNLTDTNFILLNNKFNISEIKDRFEKLLKKFGGIDWDVVRNLKPDTVSHREFQKEINKSQEGYERRIEKVMKDLNMGLKQYNNNCSQQYSNLRFEVFRKIDNLSADVTRKITENENRVKEHSKKLSDSAKIDVKESASKNFTNILSDINKLKSTLLNEKKLVFEKLNENEGDISKIKNEIQKYKTDSLGSVKLNEQNLKDLQKNINDTNNILRNSGEDIEKIKQQVDDINEHISSVEQKMEENRFNTTQYCKKSYEDILNQTDEKISRIKHSTLQNISLLGRQLTTVKEDSLKNQEPIRIRVENIDVLLEKLKNELEEYKTDSTSNFGVLKTELKKIHENFIETKKRSMNNEAETTKVKDDLDEVTKKLDGFQKTILEYNTDVKTLNDSIQLHGKSISQIFPKLVQFRKEVDVINSHGLNITDDVHNLEKAVDQIETEIFKVKDVPVKIKMQGNEIDNLKHQVEALGTDATKKAEENKMDFEAIKQNMSDISRTLKNEDTKISDLKAGLQDILGKLGENEKLVETSKQECLNYVNIRMKSVTEEIAQIHDLILKKNEELRRVETDLNEKLTTCCDETRKELRDKDMLIKHLQESLDKLSKQVSENNSNIAKINKLIDQNLNGEPEPARQ
ncbi:uncharacterized protein [Leptinotarsa decemlineata]|uniref:uncharacterized protein n=1 Tax=Leptinotarsa decemlineata TaxID=7539 RepID=UPI003D30685C